MTKFISDDKKKNIVSELEKNAELVIKYMNKVARPVVLGEVSLEIKIALDKTENVIKILLAEEKIRRLSDAQLKAIDKTEAYELTTKPSIKKAYKGK